MASLISDFEINKNAVIIHYPHVYPYGPAWPDERPTGCVVHFYGFSISACVYDHYFTVSNPQYKIYKRFDSLKFAKRFIIDFVNSKRTFFDG